MKEVIRPEPQPFLSGPCNLNSAKPYLRKTRQDAEAPRRAGAVVSHIRSSMALGRATRAIKAVLKRFFSVVGTPINHSPACLSAKGGEVNATGGRI
jgi:hypothetical protein